MQEASRDWVNAWEHYHVEAYEFRELDDERVLVFFRYGGRGKVSGVELERLGVTGAGVFHVHSGKVARVIAYWDHERALADLGLKSDRGFNSEADR